METGSGYACPSMCYGVSGLELLGQHITKKSRSTTWSSASSILLCVLLGAVPMEG